MSDQTEKSELGPISLVRQIKSGQLKYENLSKEGRICCVEFLMQRECSTAAIAEVLGVSDKTVYRRKTDIKKKNAIKQSPEFTSQYVGSLHQKMEHICGSLIKMSQEDNSSDFARVSALTNAGKKLLEYSRFLQSIGYLPGQSQTDIDENCELPNFDDMMGQLATLKDSFEQADAVDTAIDKDIAEIEDAITIITVSKKIKQVESKIVEAKENECK